MMQTPCGCVKVAPLSVAHTGVCRGCVLYFRRAKVCTPCGLAFRRPLVNIVIGVGVDAGMRSVCHRCSVLLVPLRLSCVHGA